MMNKAVLVGSPPLQEELLRPRRRQQPRQHPRPWEGTSLFFFSLEETATSPSTTCAQRKHQAMECFSCPLFINIIRGNLSTIM